jgi:hypothetical protein
LYRRLTPAGRRDADRARTLGFLGLHPSRLATIRRWWRAWCREERRVDVRVGSRRGGRASLVSIDLEPLQALGEVTVEHARAEIASALKAARVGTGARIIAWPGGFTVQDVPPNRAPAIAAAVGALVFEQPAVNVSPTNER